MGPLFLASVLLHPVSIPAGAPSRPQELTLEESEAIASFSGAVFLEWSEAFREGRDPFAEEGARALVQRAEATVVTVAGKRASAGPEGVDWLAVSTVTPLEPEVADAQAAVIRAFEGMHPTLRQTPPQESFSIQRV